MLSISRRLGGVVWLVSCSRFGQRVEVLLVAGKEIAFTECRANFCDIRSALRSETNSDIKGGYVKGQS